MWLRRLEMLDVKQSESRWVLTLRWRPRGPRVDRRVCIVYSWTVVLLSSQTLRCEFLRPTLHLIVKLIGLLVIRDLWLSLNNCSVRVFWLPRSEPLNLLHAERLVVSDGLFLCGLTHVTVWSYSYACAAQLPIVRVCFFQLRTHLQESACLGQLHLSTCLLALIEQNRQKRKYNSS